MSGILPRSTRVENGITYSVSEDGEGNVFWYKHNTLIRHREGGPAIEWFNGSKSYYYDDQLHRTDGPAWEEVWINNVIYSWWYQDKKIDVSSQEEFEQWIKLITFE